MSRLRVGCVGTGFIAGQHLAALAGFPDVDIVAVADAARDRAEDVAQRYQARAYDDGLRMLETEELDAVWVCVPPFAHGPVEDAAIDRRLPLFVEKPLAMDLPTAAQLAARIRDTGLLTCVGYHWRSLDVVEQAARLLRDTPAQLVTGAWLDRTPAAPWWSQRSSSGGQLVEQTTHLVDLARLLVGEVDRVQALEATVAREAWPAADVPTASAVLLSFRSGAIGTISSSCVLDRRRQVGLRLVAPGRLVDISEVGLYDHTLRIADDSGEQVVQTDENPIAREDRAFLDALRTGGDVPVTYEDALRTHAVVCAADRSARDGGIPLQVDGFLAEQTPSPGEAPK
ncbi:Gfo/Idh/MocA family protein [Geodermatophilus chilensis]|uniref:Gfo/Idh/MocA family protein n=1 Tax=Geodermatophilus chilensis TaxID=2035835 RepID=UPI0022B7D86C|nr:Gfo/Idh/MocA family oxidoreductase [Geodermatophilus chilensis]